MVSLLKNFQFELFLLDNTVQNIYVRGQGTIKIALLGADDTAARILHTFANQSCSKKGALSQLSSSTRRRIQVFRLRTSNEQSF
jgi:hypothetical protein